MAYLIVLVNIAQKGHFYLKSNMRIVSNNFNLYPNGLFPVLFDEFKVIVSYLSLLKIIIKFVVEHEVPACLKLIHFDCRIYLEHRLV